MKTKYVILGGLALAGAGIWYLFFKNRHLGESTNQDPVGPIQKEESGLEHIRQVFHKAKEFTPESAI
jgi:hypothetical protein